METLMSEHNLENQSLILAGGTTSALATNDFTNCNCENKVRESCKGSNGYCTNIGTNCSMSTNHTKCSNEPETKPINPNTYAPSCGGNG